MVLRAAEAIGQRVKQAREDSGLTQEELARAVRLDRSSLAKIETGARKVSALELAQIAEHLSVRLEWFVEDAPPAVVSRRNVREPGSPSPAIDQAAERIAHEVEFVMAHDSTLADCPALEAFRRPSNRRETEEMAQRARALLQVGSDEPIYNLAASVAQIGLLAFSLDLGTDAADGASMLLGTGGIAVVNGNRHVGRRRLTLAHELGHFLFADEFSVDWHVADPGHSDKHESTIDRFARALLLPQAALEAAWEEHSSAPRSLREAAVITASEFRVDMSTLARRSSELGIVKKHDADQIRQIRTTQADIITFNLLIAHELEPPELPRPYIAAVLRLYGQETISGPRALDLLLDTWDESDLPELAELPGQAIWSFVS